MARVVPTTRVITQDGSIDQHHLDRSIGDFATLRNFLGIDRVTVISCDPEVHEVVAPRLADSVAVVGLGLEI